jgi:hypothetical protein
MGIASVRKSGTDVTNFELKTVASDEPYFVVKAGLC